jgi:Spy/CpxP family protein refolding chaperone
MKKKLCRAVLAAFALTLAVSSTAQSKMPVPSAQFCHEGKHCKESTDCQGCPRCGGFCDAGTCVCP